MFKFIQLPLFILLVSFPSQILAYPASVSLTSDVALAAILADIPFVSVGLLGFGVYSFFFVMKRLNRVTNYIHVSVLLAFIAAIFDLSQIFKRGYWNMTYDLDVSSVEVLIIFREISHALSFAMRYLFFWAFVAEPPRGELPFVPMQEDRRPNFISLGSDSLVHSGDWARLKLFGIILKWALLLLILAVLTLQILWRLVNAFKNYGPVYITEAGIEIGLSAAFILKLLLNAFLSPLSPRWHTIRDYSPVITALSISMGVVIGNLICFKFTETTLGRFFQAVEFYVLILFVLISAFYKMPVRSSVVAELIRRRLTAAGFGDIENPAVTGAGSNRQSQFSMVQAPYSMPRVMGTSRENDNKRQEAPSRPSFTQRISSNSIFSSLVMSRRGGSGQLRTFGNQAGKEEGDQHRLWNKDNPSPVPSPGGQRSFRTSLEQTPEQTPTIATRDAPGWKDPVFTSIIPQMRTEPPNAASAANKENWETTVSQIVVPDDASQYTSERNSAPVIPPQPSYSRNETESPIYGLDGIIRNLQQENDAKLADENDVDTVRSSGIESLLRQQAELEKSIAGLRRFSTTSATRKASSRMPSDSLQSDISLSNFPEPPAFVKSLKTKESSSLGSIGLREDTASVPETELDRSKSMAISAISDNSLIVDDVPFQLVPPRMPAAMTELSERQNPYVPTIPRDSLESVLGNPNLNRTGRLGSQGTQYDVTSFIGGLTAPADLRDSPQLTDISERERSSETDSGSNVPATITDVTRVQVIGEGRPSEESVPDSGIGHSAIRPPVSVPSEPTVNQSQPQPSLQLQPESQSQSTRPQLLAGGKAPGLGRGWGLPTGPRGRLEISNPIRQNSGILNERTFERPRPAPLVLQNVNNARPTPAEPPRNGGYF